jgi:hypothetical protein
MPVVGSCQHMQPKRHTLQVGQDAQGLRQTLLGPIEIFLSLLARGC